MGHVREDNTIRFEGVVYEDETVGVRDILQEISPAETVFDFSGCNDVHLAVLQVILAYKKLYSSSFIFPDEKKLYQLVCEGFDPTEIHCA